MNFFKRYLGWLAAPLAVVMFLSTSGLGTVQAGIVATDEAADVQALAADRDALIAALDREDVREQLVAMGISPEEATQRIGAMSRAELAMVSDRLNTMPAGQGPLGFVLGVVLVVLIVFLVTDALEVTDVY